MKILVLLSNLNDFPFYRNKQCVLGCFIMMLFNCFAIGFNEIYPVWAGSSTKYRKSS